MTTKHLNRATIALAATLLTACQLASPLQALRPLVRPQGSAATDQLRPAALVGRAVFPAQRRVAAATADVSAFATLAVIDPATSRTMATGLTGAGGAFTLDVDTSFSPAEGSYYYLQVSRRVSGASGNQVSMITVVMWTAAGWASITNAVGGAGAIVVNSTTTAVALIDRQDPSTGFADLMGIVSGKAYGGITAFGDHGVTQIWSRAEAVTSQLEMDTDPVGDRPASRSGLMAPGDFGDEFEHHDYTVSKNGQNSVFVWIPVFTAYQLIQPAKCGAIHAGSPVGMWVKDHPSSGVEEVDWARETFGGFYAGKYEASRNDATPTAAGSSPILKVQQDRVPWIEVTWTEAAKACLSYDAHCHMMQDDEWTALAVWAMIHDVTVHGNNSYRQSTDDYDITFTADSTDGDGVRARTGTGTKAGWSGNTNLTTHTGTTAGVYDLNGNVWEYTSSLRVSNDSYVVDDVPLLIAPVKNEWNITQGCVSSLHTDPRLRRYGVPATISNSGNPVFGSDYISTDAAGTRVALRGGEAREVEYAGLWEIRIENEEAAVPAYEQAGFRPVLKY